MSMYTRHIPERRTLDFVITLKAMVETSAANRVFVFCVCVRACVCGTVR
jgi:hypothetical protein